MNRKDNIKLYKPTPTWFAINCNDRNLHPVYISLPTPPKETLIDGYGDHPDDQFFKRRPVPQKLKVLESRVIAELQDMNDRNPNIRVSEWRIYKRFWDTLESERDHY